MDRTLSWLLPDGVFDVLPPEAAQLERVRRLCLDLLTVHGFELVIPPLVEYTETLLGHASEDLKRQTFKIIDQQNGRLMGIRADITQQIARIDARVQNRSDVARYCYAAPVLRTLPQAVFESRTPFQLGAEIYGHPGISADIELIELALGLFTALGYEKPLHLDLGHVGIFPMLCELHHVTEAQMLTLSEMIDRKAPHEIRRYASQEGLSTDFETLVRLCGPADAWVSELSPKAQAHELLVRAILDLRRVQMHLEKQWPQVSQSSDAGQIASYHYHTSVVFSVFGGGSEALVRGGRYDGVATTDQHVRPAAGFSLDLATLSALVPGAAGPRVIAVPDLADDALTALIQDHRAQGDVVFKVYGREKPARATHFYRLEKGKWLLEQANA